MTRERDTMRGNSERMNNERGTNKTNKTNNEEKRETRSLPRPCPPDTNHMTLFIEFVQYRVPRVCTHA